MERTFPCLDGHRYLGCVGVASCPAERCWNGRRLKVGNREMRSDAFDRPLRVLRYTASDCANCLHAVDLRVDGEMRSPGGRLVKRWTACELGLWAGPASLYNLLNHRVPLRRPGHCLHFAETPPEQMRPELVRQRAADQARARARRARLRGAKREAARLVRSRASVEA
ncbi:MAG TPA: hypothetical protein VK009_04085 [Chloroflexota bacterium]|nr:hypothetical protein [Chloroflexota bacterium]